ncbi:AMP-binding protein [Frankia sp. CNm7]|uniref:long-chain-fatty-acid--CoA ligase n=1 Tax=Frankia nepalensis TaxID=1836974 RepID=A0A937UP69_9ACTN|nr:AMP-binding protein [Frankia nepalensis]MBL7502056.1 AMP-binding protein [Frankia nepalensis]MBL7511962.1 AMP-binding protein [Frankia nepalensis]MBL7524048.1 AMP-binding protein [Frankia nepalensis]MBL7630554.1 AMP-binding protein [Frankia nepalensis]
MDTALGITLPPMHPFLGMDMTSLLDERVRRDGEHPFLGGVCGLSLFAGYVGDPAATAEAFGDDGWLRTGDRVTVLPGGALRFAERAKDMLKVSGENVAAAEIERVVASVPGVREAAVVARKDSVRGEVAVAFVTVTADAGQAALDEAALEEAIIAVCRQRLADFKVPRAAYVVPDLPRVTLDKISKGVLRQWAADRHAAENDPTRQVASR